MTTRDKHILCHLNSFCRCVCIRCKFPTQRYVLPVAKPLSIADLLSLTCTNHSPITDYSIPTAHPVQRCFPLLLPISVWHDRFGYTSQPICLKSEGATFTSHDERKGREMVTDFMTKTIQYSSHGTKTTDDIGHKYVECSLGDIEELHRVNF